MKHTIFHILEKSDWHKGYTGKNGKRILRRGHNHISIQHYLYFRKKKIIRPEKQKGIRSVRLQHTASCPKTDYPC